MILVQAWKDKQNNYFGSDKWFYSGVTLSSGTAWTFVNFSGTNSLFGFHGREEGNRFMINSSGTSFMQWSWNSGASVDGEVWAGDTASFDGVSRSGVWLRTNTASQTAQIWTW